MSKDYYGILGVEKNASQDEIKRAYRKNAMKYHPDKNPGDTQAEAKFKDVNEAYQVLGDSSKRQNYDRFGSAEGFGRGAGGAGFGGGFDVDLGDIFEQMFGGASGGSGFGQSRKSSGVFNGEDVQVKLNLDLKTAVFGGKKTIKYKVSETCHECSGDGGTGKKTCTNCGGSGYSVHRQNTVFGAFEQRVTCKVCSGTGETVENVCNTCLGKKRVIKEKTFELEVPAGIDDGMRIRIAGEGSSGIGGGNPGDLYVIFSVKSEEKGLKRDGINLYYNLEISSLEATLGTDIEINLPLIGKRIVEVKSGTQFGSVVKFSNDGVKSINSEKKGDLIINLDIKIPSRITEKERKKYEEIAEIKKVNVHNKKGILEKLFS